MSLDIYLRKSETTMYDDGEKLLSYPAELKVLEDDIDNRQHCLSVTTSYQVGHWPKFEALHRYIIKNFADGVYDGDEVYLDKDDLVSILKICDDSYINHKLSSELFPNGPTSLFDYETYFSEIRYTRDIIKKIITILNNYGTYDVFYSAN